MATNKPALTSTLENVRLLFRNFAGEQKQFNNPGDRNFCVVLDPETAVAMEADGWPVKQLKAREEDEQPQDYLKVKVNFRNSPPLVKIITSKGGVVLDEEAVAMLDYADIGNVDLILTQYNWDVSGKSGITAYLKKIFVTLNEDELDLKYADVKDLGVDSATADGDAVAYPRFTED